MLAPRSLPRHVIHVGFGTWRIDVAAPLNRPPQVNVYALEAAGGLLLVDTGWDATSHHDLLSGLTALGAGPKDVTGIVLTHGHPDHSGLAARLQQESDCWVGVHPHDRRWFSGASPASPRLGTAGSGIPPDELAAVTSAHVNMPEIETPELVDLGHNSLVTRAQRTLRVLWTPGHTPGHLCLLDEGRFLFTGDHALPDYRPSVHVGDRESGSTYSDYISSLTRIRGLAPIHLPGHGGSLTAPEARLEQLEQDLAQRIETARQTLGTLGPATAWDLAQRMPSSRSWAELGTLRRAHAAADALQRLRHLESLGQVVRGPGDTWRVSR